MGEKIVTIGTTIFMLLICLLAVTTLNLINKEKDRDMAKDLISNSAISTEGNIEDSDRLVVSGSSLISSITGMYQIDNKILDARDKIYQMSSKKDGAPIAAYVFEYSGTRSNTEIIKAINPDAKYEIEYTPSTDDLHHIIKIKDAV